MGIREGPHTRVKALHVPWCRLSSCLLSLALENRALAPTPLPNPPTNSPMLQWASKDSRIRTTLHCFPSLAFCQTEPALKKLYFTRAQSFLFSLLWLQTSPIRTSTSQRAWEYLPMCWNSRLLCVGLDGVQNVAVGWGMTLRLVNKKRQA